MEWESGGILKSWAVKVCRYFEVETGYHFCSQSVPVRATFFPFCPSGCASFLLLSFFSHYMNEVVHGNSSLFFWGKEKIEEVNSGVGNFFKGSNSANGENDSVGHGATHSLTNIWQGAIRKPVEWESGGILKSWAVKDCRYFEVETGYHFCSQSVPVRATFFPFCPSGCASFLFLSFFSPDMNEVVHGNSSLFFWGKEKIGEFF